MYCNGIKRVLGIILSLIGIIVFSWLLLIISIAIIIDDPGPVFFKQERIGIHKKHFIILKFRSMKMSTPQDVPTHLLTDPEQYITRVGHFLRKTSLDELPQFFNIFKGDMAVIGPRPALWNQFDLIEARDCYGANDVRPGLTGWAQINGRDELEIDVKARLDGEYVKELRRPGLHGFRMDLKCFGGSIKAVFSSKGVVEGGTGALEGQKETNKKILLVANVAKEHMLKFHVPTIEEFTKHGWTVDVACAGEEEIPFCRKQYHMIWKRSPFSVKTIQGIHQLKRILGQEHYDVIYCHTPVGGIATRLAAKSSRKKGTKVIYCAHGFHFFKGAPRINWVLYYPIEKFLARLTDVVFTVNQEDYQNAKKRFAKRTDVRLVPEVGVDFSRLQIEHRDEVRKKYRSDLNIPDDAFVMIYVAELIPNKNQGMLIDALIVLRDSGENVYLLLPGPEHDDGAFQNYAKTQKVDAYCRFLGWRSDIGQLLSVADVCTASSIREGFGINLVEAMYCGLPVVATRNRGHRMIIEDSRNGFLVEINDFSGMASKIKWLMDDQGRTRSFYDHDTEKYDNRQIAKVLREEIEAI